jgi:hypothetical protein
MKEFSIFTSAEERHSLYPGNVPHSHEPFFDEARNMIAEARGMRSLESLYNPFSVSQDFPFPQIFLGHQKWLLCDKDAIYEIDGFWNLTKVLDLTADYTADPTLEYNTWHFADFYNYVLLTNGEFLVHYDTTTDTLEKVTVSSSMPLVYTLTNFKGQLFAGGVLSSFNGCDETFYLWSKIGAADFTIDQSNIAGFRAIEGKGNVLRTEAMDKMVVIGGEESVSIAVPAETTFGHRRLIGEGIPSRDAIAYGNGWSAIVTNSGTVFALDDGGKLTRLGYRDHINTLDLSELVISYASIADVFYLSDGTKTYVLTEHGLTESYQIPANVQAYDGQDISVYSMSGDTEGLLIFSPIDFRLKGFKTITAIEVGVTTGDDFYVAADWKNAPKDSWRRSSFIKCSPQGVGYLTLTANIFRPILKFTAGTGTYWEDATIRIKLSDKRAVRGQYANQITS